MAVKKSKAKAKPRGQKTQKSGTGSRKIDVVTLRQRVINKIGAGAMKMVGAAIGEAEKGHYQAVKFLFELAGIFPAPAIEEKAGEAKSYSEILCRQMGLLDEPNTDQGVTEVCGQATAAAEHALESGSGH
jgi:hypothetical protein